MTLFVNIYGAIDIDKHYTIVAKNSDANAHKYLISAYNVQLNGIYCYRDSKFIKDPEYAHGTDLSEVEFYISGQCANIIKDDTTIINLIKKIAFAHVRSIPCILGRDVVDFTITSESIQRQLLNYSEMRKNNALLYDIKALLEEYRYLPGCSGYCEAKLSFTNIQKTCS